MKLVELHYKNEEDFVDFINLHKISDTQSTFIQMFSSNQSIEKMLEVKNIVLKYLSNSSFIGTSTAGIIENGTLRDDAIILSFSLFEKTTTESFSYCKVSVEEILLDLEINHIRTNTKLMVVFANTFRFDAEDFLKKCTARFPNIVIAGGNAGDDFRFERCYLLSNKCEDCDLSIALLHSDELQIKTKYLLNWQTIGQEMLVTKSQNATVYEINHKRAIDIYEEYLGKEIASNMLTYGIEFPLIYEEYNTHIARAAVGVDLEMGTITFAGNIPQGSKVKFGYANIEYIANKNKEDLENQFSHKREAMYVYSCGARRQMLGNFLIDELATINQIAPTSGFITYGEFFHNEKSCTNELLNITTTCVILGENGEGDEPLELQKIDVIKNKKDVIVKAFTTLVEKTSRDLDENLYYLEQFQKAVYEASIFSITDKKGHIIEINKNFETISGYTKEELIGKSHNVVRDEEMPKETFVDMWKTIQNGQMWKGIVKNKRKDGTPYYVMSQILPIYKKDGSFKEYIGIRNDVTELEEYKSILKNELDTTNRTLDENLHYIAQYEKAINTTTAILKTDRNNIITYANSKFCEISKYTYEELLGMNCKELRHQKHKEEKLCDEIKEKLGEKQILNEVFKNITKDGKEYTVTNLFYPIVNLQGEVYEHLQIMHDISEIIELNEEIINTQKEVVYTMGAIGETRSKETGLHVIRVAEYSYLIAKLYGLDESEASLLKQASPMHDIGKVGIPDSILNKPGKLTPDEFEIMKTHAQLGYEMLKHSNKEILKASATVALTHHEKWNGSGYPKGLSGEDIHIYGRITAVADVFDALGHDRCYKKAWELEKILALFEEEKGKHFDPKIIELFMTHLDEFLAIRDKLQD